MAKKRKKTTVRRRRRVGATSLNANNPIVKWGSVAAGYFMGDKINTKITSLVDKDGTNKNLPLMIGGAEAGIGALLVFGKGKGKQSTVKSVAGGVLLGAGVKQLMSHFGIGSIPYGRVPVIAGSYAYGRVPVIGNGYTPNNALNGYTPNNALNGAKYANKVMAGVETGSGSGLMKKSGSELMN